MQLLNNINGWSSVSVTTSVVLHGPNLRSAQKMITAKYQFKIRNAFLCEKSTKLCLQFLESFRNSKKASAHKIHLQNHYMKRTN